jgi:phosphorylcholine metabolism protein LicD
MFDKLAQGIIYAGMPVVAAYHMICSNVFLNTAAQDAEGFEKAGNIILAPAQFLLAGKVAVNDQGKYQIQQRFDYHHHLPLKSTAAIFSLPITLPLGSLLKGIGYLSEATQQRHKAIVAALESTDVQPNIDYYRDLGLAVTDQVDRLDSPQYKRKPGEENALKIEKDLLREIVQIFNQNKIPFWVDCGTCLGAYRYGGAIPWDGDVDVAILLPDFDNAMHALNGLDKNKYQVQDWSNRCRPKTYIRIYIPENRNFIDIYCFAIDPETKTLTYVLSNEISAFMVDSWVIRESRFKVPSSFDTIFPLRKAYFDGIEVYVPNNTKKYLQERYGENIGPVKILNELTGKYEKDLSHPYWKLPHVYQ